MSFDFLGVIMKKRNNRPTSSSQESDKSGGAPSPRILAAISRRYGISAECQVIQNLATWLLLGKQGEIYKSSKDLAKEIGVSLSSVKRAYKKFQEDLEFCPFIKSETGSKKNFKVSFFSLDIDSLKDM